MLHRSRANIVAALALLSGLAAASLHAQDVERHTLPGREIAVYNLAGEVRVAEQ